MLLLLTNVHRHTLCLIYFLSAFFKLSMMNTAGSPTCLMEISAAVISHISWAPLLPSPVLQALSWNKVQGRLSVSIPAVPTGMTASLCAKVSFRVDPWLYLK